MSPTQQASRTDAARRIEQRIDYFGPAGDRVIGTTDIPLDGASNGVVICASIWNDFLRNYGREVKLGRELAAQGVAVQRFQYRGTGNSDGDEAATTFDSMVADARAAADHLREVAGVSRVAFVGTRFGAPIAAAAVSGDPTAPIALIDPAVQLSTFFREAWRAVLVGKLGKGDGTPATTDALLAELREKGSVDVLGHAVHRALFETSHERTLLGELGGAPRPVLVVGFGTTLRPEFQKLVGALEEGGAKVATELLGEQYSWWVVEETHRPVDLFVPTVAGWIQEQW